MSNSSIFAAFERMWQHISNKLADKSEMNHNHDDVYYTEAEMDEKLSHKSDSTHNHDSAYDSKGSASTALAESKSYTDSKTENLATAVSVSNSIINHNVSEISHNDIRNLIDGLSSRLNALADSDDTTLDQLSEIVTYIKSNKDLIDSVTTSKVNVSDIIDNLETNVSNKPLSAAQGVALKNELEQALASVDGQFDELIAMLETAFGMASDEMQNIEDRLSNHGNDTDNPHKVTLKQLGVTATVEELNGYGSKLNSHINDKSNPHRVTKNEVGLGNVENKSAETILSEMTYAHIVNALGYEPSTVTIRTWDSADVE